MTTARIAPSRNELNRSPSRVNLWGNDELRGPTQQVGVGLEEVRTVEILGGRAAGQARGSNGAVACLGPMGCQRCGRLSFEQARSDGLTASSSSGRDDHLLLVEIKARPLPVGEHYSTRL